MTSTRKSIRESLGRARLPLEPPGVGVMRRIGEAILQDVDARFATKGYGTWTPLSPLTIKRKGGRTDILIDTGNMRNSVGIGTVTANRVTVTVPYGGAKRDPSVPMRHQRGDPAIGLPQRKIVEVTEQLKSRIRPIIREWVRGGRN